MPNYTIEELLGKEEEEENKVTNYTLEELLGKKEEQPKPSMQQLDDAAAGKEAPSLFDLPTTMLPGALTYTLMRDKTPAEKADLARVAATVPVGAAKLVYDAVDLVQSQFTEDEWGDAPFNQAVRKTAMATGLDRETVDRVLESDGKIKKTETNLGTGAEVGSWLLGYKGVKKLLGEGQTLFTEGVKVAGASALTSQVLSDPSYNTGNALEDFLGDTENFNNGYTMAVAEALSADDDDSVAVKRLKILGEEPLFMALGFAGGKSIGAAGWAASKSRELFNKPVADLTAKERSRLTGAFLDDAKERVQIVSDNPLEIRVDNVEEEFIQLPTSTLGRMKSFITPTLKKYFTSQGQFTKKAFDAFKGSEIAQRKWLARSEFIGASLQRSLDDLADGTLSAEMSEKVMRSLNSDTSFLSEFKTRNQKIKAFAEAFDLNPEVAKHAYSSRELIDELSGKLENIKLPEGTREAIGNNIGAYMRRSYRKYEDPNYEPSTEVYNKAFEYFKQLNKGDETKARQQIEDILGADWEEAYNHFSNVKGLNRKIFTQKKTDEELPKVVRELLGEIENPTESLVLSIAKASKLYENMKFYTTFENLGMKGNYIFTRENLPLRGSTPFEQSKDLKNFVEIKGTNSSLDGKYTTRPMYDALMQREATIGALADNQIYKYFLMAKGVSQASKTVYSWTTNLRNISGGFQFGLANGLNPLSGGGSTVKTIFAGIRKKGDQGIVDKYNEYMGLGVINTNVRVNEFRNLISEGYDGELKGILNAVEGKLSQYGTAGTVVGKTVGAIGRGPEHFYLAVDDFYKINAYEQELAILRRARPNASTEVIQNEAAEIVKNTFPNYDRVPPGIKALRQLPLGNFISFPAEIVRTSANIVRRAGKEITSGNEVLRNRGLARLAGFTVSSSAWSGLSYGGAYYMGWTEEQQQAAEVLSETPWSKDAPKYFTMLDGKIASLDTQFLDSYSAVKEPLMAVVRELEKGELQGDALDDRVLNASAESLKVLLNPYISQSMLTEIFTDVGYAAVNPRGVTPKGREYFSDRQTALDSVWAIALDTAKTFSPGVIDNIIEAKDLVLDKPVGGIDEPLYENKSAVLIKNSTGFNFREFRPEENLYWAGKTFIASTKKIPAIKTDWNKPSEKILQEHLNTQEARFDAFQELYRKYQAGIAYYGKGNSEIVKDAFIRAGVPKVDVNFIEQGMFRPSALSDDKAYDLMRKATEFDKGSEIYNTLREQIYHMSYTRLDEPLEDQLEAARLQFEQRFRKAKGGEVLDVPNTAPEPDQRIDKMTGRPYDQQAGTAFTDQEDRQDPLQRMGFNQGSAVTSKGRKIYTDEKGQNYSERTETIQLKNGKWVNYPTIDREGKKIPSNIFEKLVESQVTDKGVIDFITGEALPTYKNMEEAVEAAKKRSDSLQRKKFNRGGTVQQDVNNFKADFMKRLQFETGGYVIKRGDTLSGIARSQGSTVEELQRLNEIENIDRIYAGDTINVPSYLKEEEEEKVDEDVVQFSDDVAVAVVEKVFSANDLETELLQTRERAIPVVKSKIPAKVSKDFVPSPDARKYDFANMGSRDEAIDKFFTSGTKDKVEKTLKAPVDYVVNLAENWWETRQDVNKRYEAGEITDLERGLWNTAGHINTVATPVVDLLGAIAGGTARTLGIDDELAAVGDAVVETISESEAAQELLKLMEENPRAARNIESVAQVVGAVSALKVFERGFNRIAEGVRTKQEGFYDVGRTSLGKMAIVGKDFVKKVPSAALDAVVPWRSRARNMAGASTIKVSDELDLDLTSQDRFASMATARYIRWQSREKNLGILDNPNSPFALANEYKFLESWNEAEVRKQIFEDISSGGNLGLRVPDAIQDLASAHVKQVWGKGNKEIDKANTGIVIKRPDGPQQLGNEALGVQFKTASNPIKAILAKGGGKFKSSKEQMIKFLNDRNKKEIEDKAIADYKAISTKGAEGYLIPSKRPFKNQAQAKAAALKEAGFKPMQSVDEMSSQDFKDYLTFKNIDFEEGPDDFVIIKASHVSSAKEIGGVNDFIAVDTKKGDVFSMISDKHDIGKDIDPIKGRSLLTIQPMVSSNFKTLEIPKYRPRNIAAERQAARKLAQETGVPLRKTQEGALGFDKKTGAPRNTKAGRNTSIEYMEDVLRDVSTSKEFTRKDVKDVARRSTLLGSSGNTFRDTAEKTPDVYKNKETLLSLLRRVLDDNEEQERMIASV